MPKAEVSCREAALKLLGRRSYSVFELRRKLDDKGFAAPEINAEISWLQVERLLNDEEYARARVRYRAEVTGWGRYRIEQELKQRGIPEKLAEQALHEFEQGLEQPLDLEAAPMKVRPDHDWQEQAAELLERKFKSPIPKEQPAKAKEQKRRLEFLVRRGFSLEQARSAMGQLDF